MPDLPTLRLITKLTEALKDSEKRVKDLEKERAKSLAEYPGYD